MPGRPPACRACKEEYIESSDKAESLDAFVCQLSTNDMYDSDTLGTVSESVKTTSQITTAEKETTYGAIEYICALVKETWDCPIVFYTNPSINLTNVVYPQTVTALNSIAGKRNDVTVPDLYNDTDFNNITDVEYNLYMTDSVHPTKAGVQHMVASEVRVLPCIRPCHRGRRRRGIIQEKRDIITAYKHLHAEHTASCKVAVSAACKRIT